MATPGAADLGQFFDFGEAAMPDVLQDRTHDIATTEIEASVPVTEVLEGVQDTTAEFNTDFSSWLPRYQKPARPCDYCRLKGLECFIYDSDGTGRSRCSPCNALFRPCSFNTNTETIAAQRTKTAIDTLDIVGEDEERCFGRLTGKKPLRSLGHMGPIEDDNEEEERPRKGAAAARFPKAAVKVLKEWMLQHIDHPYPTEEEKESLKQKTGLSIGQISNWMANTRRRQKSRPKRCASPSLRPSTEVMNIPAGRTWESLDPFERWKHSPPENEPAPLTAIAQAMETFDPPEAPSIGGSSKKETSNDSTGSFSIFRAPSISSLETGLTNMSSGSLGSFGSAYSHGSRHSLGSMNSLKSKERRRRRRIPTRAPKLDLDEGPRLFQCTFCTDRFKSKYDWSRHEKSLHLSLEKWICAPLGEKIVDKTTGKLMCVYCDMLEPSDEHVATHGHNACCEKGLESRTFYRKDHLRQHLRLMHNCKMTASMDSWKSEAQFIKSRCGFCGTNFNKWQDRVDHLAKEFRNGANMKNWKGCRGLDPHVAIHVTNAMPPYLIGNESKSPFPFSASNSSSLNQTHMHLESADLEYLLPPVNLDLGPSNDLSIAYKALKDPNFSAGPIILSTPDSYSRSQSPKGNPNATCWEILTLRLGRFARQHIEKHGADSITDIMLQDEARVILYGVKDGWEQTAADNPEWLNLFKKAHGITTKAPVTGINSHHEVYEDLGVNANSALDPSFNINNFTCENIPDNDPIRAMEYECTLSGTVSATKLAYKISSGRQSPRSLPGLTGSTSVSPASQTSRAPIVTNEEMLGIYAPISEMACTSPGGPCYGENGEVGFSVHSGECSKKKRYWLNDTTSSMASFYAQCTASGKPVYQCEKVGLRSFSPMNEQNCMSTLPEQECTKTGEPVFDINSLQFPSFDQLPEEYQNPTTSADFCSTIPIGTTGVGASGFDATSGNGLMWDNEEMNFVMDMDMDLDMDLNVLGKC